MMYLERIILSNFKNYEKQRIEFSEGINAFTGNNGMGKTNLLDAIFACCIGKSNFASSDSDNIRFGSDFARLESHWIREGKKEKIVLKLLSGRKKELERNDVLYKKIADHIGLFPVVMICPDDTQLATEGSEMRRKFMDISLSQLDQQYLQQLVQYNKVIDQRNAALKKMAENHSINHTLLDTYDEQLIPAAAYIFQARQAFVLSLIPYFEHCHRSISGEQEAAELSYKSPLQERDFKQILLDNRQRDSILQRTSSGIHKDDLIYNIDNQILKKFASQGQLKTFVLALKLAQYTLLKAEKDITPVLLLDDIFDKLDAQRVKNLIDFIRSNAFGQVFLTDTQAERIAHIAEALGVDIHTFGVEMGTVK